MTWNSWSDFWSMGGYGLYVWGSYLVTVVFMATEVVMVVLRRKSILEHLGRLKRSGRLQSSEGIDETEA